MGREIQGAGGTGTFYPMVGLRNKGNFVRGIVQEIGTTANSNPVATLQLADLDGTTSVSVSKGIYKEVEVNVGDLVTIVGSVKDLRDKLPQLKAGDDVTITFIEKKKLPKGTKNIFKVEVN